MPLSIHPVFLMERAQQSYPSAIHCLLGWWQQAAHCPASCLGAAPDPEATKLVTQPLCLWISPLCLSKPKSLAGSSSQVLLAGVCHWGESVGTVVLTDFTEKCWYVQHSVGRFGEAEVGVRSLLRTQIPCLCKTSLLPTGVCVLFIFCALPFTLNFHLPHQVRSGRDEVAEIRTWAQLLSVALWCDIHTFLWHSELAHLLFAPANSFVFLSML